MVYKFFRTAVTYPILFAVGVAITPWQELVNAFTLTNLLVIGQYRLGAGGDRVLCG